MLHYLLVPTSLYLAAHEHSRPYYTGGKIQIICAIVTALISNAAQYRCHLILYQLKCKKQQQDNDVSKMPYSIPKGFLFDYVCCPHYFVEIVFYLALWQTLPQSLTCLLIFCWSACNLSVVAYQHYFWYLANFPEALLYGDKKNWRILIPGVW
eukprot:gene28717-37708_t